VAKNARIDIEGERFQNWESVRVERVFDGFATFSFTAPFQVDNPAFREAFRPATFKTAVVSVDGENLITGTMMPIPPVLSASNNTVMTEGYALPGVLGDCTQSAASLPFEYKGKDLKQLVEQIAAPFSLTVDFQADPGPVFKKVKTSPQEKVLQLLTKLSKQRGVVLSSGTGGELVCRTEPAKTAPVAALDQGLPPIIDIAPSIKQQQYYSEITGLKPVRPKSKKIKQYTARNSFLTNVIRPLTMQIKNSEDGDLNTSVDAALGRMFGDMIQYVVKVSTWTDQGGVLWEPGTFIQIHAPRCMIYEPRTFFIRSVVYTETPTETVATLFLTLPGAYSGQIPEALPWDE
jgi:prophage tail gpP-like protein